VEVKFVKLDQRLDGRLGQWYPQAFHFCRRPDAKATSLAPYAPLATQGVAQREVEAREFDAGMEAVRERLNEPLTDERLRTMGHNVDDDGESGYESKKTSPDPPGPAASAPRHGFGPGKPHLSGLMPFALHMPVFSD
jgi:hypothetical protein